MTTNARAPRVLEVVSAEQVHTVTKDDLVTLAQYAGNAAGKGNDGLLNLAKGIFLAARATNIKVSDVKTFYRHYLTSSNQNEFSRKVPTDDKSIKTGVSNLTTFFKLAQRTGTDQEVFDSIPMLCAVANVLKAKQSAPASNYSMVLKGVRYINKHNIEGTISEEDAVKALNANKKKKNDDPILQAMFVLLDGAKKKAANESEPFADNTLYFNAIVKAIEEQITKYKTDQEAERAKLVAAGLASDEDEDEDEDDGSEDEVAA